MSLGRFVVSVVHACCRYRVCFQCFCLQPVIVSIVILDNLVAVIPAVGVAVVDLCVRVALKFFGLCRSTICGFFCVLLLLLAL